MTDAIQTSRVTVDNIGCKLNQAEAQHLARQLSDAGYRLVPPKDETDVYIIFTCTVTQVADSKCRQRIRATHRRNPAAKIVVTGCYAERARRELETIEGVDLVLGNSQKQNLLWLLEDKGRLLKKPDQPAGPTAHDGGSRTRAFIKIQDGCNNFCAYCIVPLVRGQEKSVSLSPVISEISRKAADGYREIVLTGTEIGAYRSQDANLVTLLGAILSRTAIERVRISSLQPAEVTPELLGLWQDQRLCRHFHISLQSGSDTVLKRMKRRYNTSEYKSILTLIKASVPGAAITTDIIVGFPGETEAEFRESATFTARMGFARIHVFAYSKRAGTAAADMPGQIAVKSKQDRSRDMLEIAAASAADFKRGFLGETLAVLWEKCSGGVWSGYTDNYLKVYSRTNRDLTNRIVTAKLTDLRDDSLWGDIDTQDD
jgi:threonylcarbamoyladenosine tRNA methylthiotransferase MtaB